MYGEPSNQGSPEGRFGPPTDEERAKMLARFAAKHAAERPPEPDETIEHEEEQHSRDYFGQAAGELAQAQQETDEQHRKAQEHLDR